MSTTDTRLAYDEAVFHAGKFRELFDPSTYELWTVAGSVRRRCRDVGDIEHVILPRIADLAGDDLYATPAPTNLFLRRLDELAAKTQIVRHDYGGGRTRWGQRHRGVDFSTLGATSTHELYLADRDNYGATLAIRTGPPDFSKRLVTGLLRNGRRNHDGYVWRCESCHCDRYGPSCAKCGGTGLVPVERVSVPDEHAYFSLCGIPFVEPEARR